MYNTLETKLNRVDNAVASIKEHLLLSNNAPIEDVVDATDIQLKKLLNIYIQENEPEKKEGIWLQMPNFEYTNVTIDETLGVKDEITGDDKWPALPASNMGLVECQDEIYGIVDSNGASLCKIYKADENMNWSLYDEIPSQTIRMSSYCASDDNYIYLTNLSGGITQIARYNPATKDIIVHKFPKSIYESIMGVYNNTLYIFGQTSNKGVTYNFDTQEQGEIPGCPRYMNYEYYNTQLSMWNGMFYIPGVKASSSSSSYSAYFFDPVANEWVANAPNPGAYNCYGTTVVGDYAYTSHYTYNTGDKWRKTNLTTGTVTNLSNISVGEKSRILYLKGTIFIQNGTKLYSLANDNSSYDSNTVIIVQGQYKLNAYKINLFSLPETKGGKLLWAVADVYPFNNGQLLTNIPTYYGNGTEWIKFKN